MKEWMLRISGVVCGVISAVIISAAWAGIMRGMNLSTFLLLVLASGPVMTTVALVNALRGNPVKNPICKIGAWIGALVVAILVIVFAYIIIFDITH